MRVLNDDTVGHARLSGRAAWQGCCLGVLLAVLAAGGSAGAPPKQVLLLHSFGREFEPFKTFSATFRTQLAEQFGDPVEFHDVPLESARFDGGAPEGLLVDYLTALFAARRLDLVVTIGGPATRFGQSYRPRLFPSTPMLLAAVDQRHLQTVDLITNDAVVAVDNNPARMLENILQVLPETTNVAVVIGISPLEKFWLGEIGRLFQPFTNRVNFVWFNDLSLIQMQKRAAALPPHSAIFYVVLAIDADGVPHEEESALAKLHAVANAPIFGLQDSQMGRGIVGGPVMPIGELSRTTAKVAVRILRGEPAGSIQTPILVPERCVYDWRELRRWHISEARLPAGSVIRFRQPTAWEMYKWRIIGNISLCLVEAVLIVLLIASLLKRRRAEGSLRESEERLSLAATAADVGVWVWDVPRSEVWVTDNWRRMFGFPPEAVIRYETVIERIHPEDRAAMDGTIQRALKARVDYASEHRVVLPDGTQRWITARGRLNPTVGTKRVEMLGVSVDITARKLAEEALRAREEVLRATFEQAAVGIAHVGTDGCWLRVNDKLCAIVGYPQEELMKLTFQDIIHPDDLEENLDYRRGLLSGETKTYSTEKRYLRKDRSVVWVNVAVSLVRTAAGEPLHFLSVVQDITARKQAEAELQKNEERLRLVMEANSEGVWDWNIPGGRAVFSPSYSRMLGYEPEEFAKDYASWKNLVHPDDFERVNKAHAEHIHEHKDFHVELRMRKKSGQWCWILSRGMVVERDAEGRAIRMVGTHQDITARKEAEVDGQRQREELAHVARVSVMGELATSVAHELNQPLGAILSNAEAAELFLKQDPPALDELHTILADIRKDDERAGEVIRRMRALLRKHELQREPLGINSLVEDVFRLVSADAALRQVVIGAELPPDLPPVEGDRIHLQQVLLNLIMNAMDAMARQPQEQRRLVVRTKRGSDGAVEVSVSDSGPGIGPEIMPRLFEPFFTTKQSGIGMGLSISRRIVEAHHGQIWAENCPTGGAIFRVTLPADAEGMKS